jgi:hypothetical protein
MLLISADAGAYMGCSAAEPCTAAVPWHGGDATATAWAVVAASGTTYVTLAEQGFHRPGTVSQRENAERRERVRGAWRWLASTRPGLPSPHALSERDELNRETGAFQQHAASGHSFLFLSGSAHPIC